jgi:hypothetical protein
MTDDDAIPDEDTSEVTKLFHERLQAWKHACGYLEDYVSATEKMQHAHAKEYEKVLKVSPHFSHALQRDTILTIHGRLFRIPSRKATTLTKTWAALQARLIPSAPTLRYETIERKKYTWKLSSGRASPTRTPKQQRPSRALSSPCSSVFTPKSRTRPRNSQRELEKVASLSTKHAKHPRSTSSC